ncbi:hypothetical protein Nepgr_014224 [Nepenthes gracilis]|uniref:Uncharacterized protein n=1 Tax=Nepenthes gracilis TaxID=150966 RepID=A0AAD3SJL2_NEPGR|nr:hypothetical protein Nepgr_014224 [Nepenthes gracilis]
MHTTIGRTLHLHRMAGNFCSLPTTCALLHDASQFAPQFQSILTSSPSLTSECSLELRYRLGSLPSSDWYELVLWVAAIRSPVCRGDNSNRNTSSPPNNPRLQARIMQSQSSPAMKSEQHKSSSRKESL